MSLFATLLCFFQIVSAFRYGVTHCASKVLATEYRLGDQVYYVPKGDRRHTGHYIPITSLHATPFAMLTLADHIVIAPKLRADGSLAEDCAASFWRSREDFEAARHHTSTKMF